MHGFSRVEGHKSTKSIPGDEYLLCVSFIVMNSLTTKKQTAKFSSANFQKM